MRSLTSRLRVVLMLAIMWCCGGIVQAQSQQSIPSVPKTVQLTEPCASGNNLTEALKNPSIRAIYEENVRNRAEAIQVRKNQKAAAVNFKIPVVVHVLSTPTDPAVPTFGTSNITDAQVSSAMQALNDAFANTAGTGASAVDVGIEFCLASNDEAGNLFAWPGMPGVTRTQTWTSNAFSNEGQHQSLLNTIEWDPSRYLNIWVVNSIDLSFSGVVGYAPTPLSPTSPLDGIVIQNNVFGDNMGTGNAFPMLGQYAGGGVLVHEAGHYLGLLHTFQGYSCTVDGDNIADTPPTTIGSTCNSPICAGAMIENYMDYTGDACMDTYTQGQADAMCQTIIDMRGTLVSQANLVQRGVPCIDPSLSANFSANVTQVCSGTAINFTAATASNTATQFSWTFPGGTPSSLVVASTTPTVSVVYNTPGVYEVCLNSTDGTNNIGNCRSTYIYVTDCGAVTIDPGKANWYFGGQAALDFSSGAPVAFTGSAMTMNEGTACASDIGASSAGFYTDGHVIYNDNHVLMDPQTHELFTYTGGPTSPAQSAVTFANPANADEHYIFSTVGMENDVADQVGVTWAVVDMSVAAANGQGQVMSTQNHPATNHATGENLVAIPHCNGENYWVIYHGADATTNSQWLAYEVSATGVNGTPVVSASHTISTTPGYQWASNLDVSFDGKMIAASVNGTTHIYEFNSADGTITALGTVPGAYGVCFSPNGQILYTTLQSDILQYDISNIRTCGGNIPVEALPQSGSTNRALQLGPDGKIYTPRFFNGALSCINFPDQLVTAGDPNACGWNLAAVPLAGRNGRMGMPNDIDAREGTPTAEFAWCSTDCGTFQFANQSCANQFLWQFGDGNSSTDANPTHTYATAGTYNVSFTTTVDLVGGGTTASTIVHAVNTGLPTAPIITGPILVDCEDPYLSASTYNISNLDPAINYEWQATGGTMMSSPIVTYSDVNWETLPGTIQVTGTDPLSGCASTTILSITCAPVCTVAEANFTQTISNCSVTFQDLSTTSMGYVITDWDWDLGDGSSSTVQNPSNIYGGAGTYLVILNITATNGNDSCLRTFASTITPCVENCSVTAGFNTSTTDCTADFTNTSVLGGSTALVGYVWDFGDGNSSNVVDPSHTYANSGIYTVCMSVTGTLGGNDCQDITCQQITITCPVACSVTANYTTAVSGCTVDFTDLSTTASPYTITSYSWDFGDSNYGNVANPSHTYASAGSYVACLTVIAELAGVSCTDTYCTTVTTTCTPACSVTANFSSTNNGCSVDFTDLSTAASPYTITSYSWDFGDLSTDNVANPTHDYGNSGSYGVCLTVIAEYAGVSCTDTYCTTVTTSCTVPCNVSATMNVSTTGCDAAFTGSASVPSGVTVIDWSWDFGDGSTGNGQYPGHSYQYNGTYNVCLTVAATNGVDTCSTVICDYVTISGCADTCMVSAAFSANASNCTVDFIDYSSAGTGSTITQYDWYFGDGTSAINGGSSPSHTYTASGNYSVCVTVWATDAYGVVCSAQFCKEVNVSCVIDPCDIHPGFKYGNKFCTVGFSNMSTVGAGVNISSYHWSFGDGNYSNVANPVHSYASSGTYTVCLTVVGEYNGVLCKRQYCEDITVTCGNTPCEYTASAAIARSSCTINATNTTIAPVGLTYVSTSWDFGDGTTGSGTSVNHTYGNPGTYNVCMTVVYHNGFISCPRTYCESVTVNCKKACKVTAKFNSMGAWGSKTRTFNSGQSFGSFGTSITGYLWEFGDGTTSNLANPTHTFPAYGDYEVCLTVYGTNNTMWIGCYDKTCKTLKLRKKKKIKKESVYNDDEGHMWTESHMKAHPNPTSGETMIDLSVTGDRKDVSVVVLSPQGQQIDVLFRGVLQEGDYHFKWTPRGDTPNGIYYLMYQDGHDMVTEKVIFMK